MNRCKDCVHWLPAEERLNSVVSYGRCKRIRHAPHGFQTPADVEVYIQRYKGERWGSYFPSQPNEMVVQDASGYHAEASCGPEFGCVLWEAK